jgi:HSP20 family protein
MNRSKAIKRTEGEVVRGERTRDRQVYSPNVDIMENKDGLMLKADMPGVGVKDIDIQYEDGLLILHGKVEPRQDESNTSYLLREYGVGDFYRSFRVGEGVDVDQIRAELKDGVMTLYLPKAEALRPRKIAVQAG